MSSRLPKMDPCPFCGSRRLERSAWGEGFGCVIHRYLGQVKCRDCGGSMLAVFEPADPDMPGAAGFSEARRLATERWNRRAANDGQTAGKKEVPLHRRARGMGGLTCATK